LLWRYSMLRGDPSHKGIGMARAAVVNLATPRIPYVVMLRSSP